MAGISVECVGADGVRVDRQQVGASDSAYLSEGESAPVGQAFLAQVSAAEAGKPEIRLSNATGDLRVDIYSVHDGRTARLRPLAPRGSRLITLTATERLLLIPFPNAPATRSKRS